MEKQLGYVLNRNGLSSDANGQTKRYFRRDLERMTVYQLREIAQRERIIQGIVNPLDKELLVEVILRYRGAETSFLICEYNAEDYEILEEAFRHISFPELKDVRLECSARITVYQGLSVDYYDNITINYCPEFSETNAFLVDSEKNLCAVFNVEPKGEDRSRLYLRKAAEFPCCEASVKRYTLLFFDRRHSELFFRFYHAGFRLALEDPCRIRAASGFPCAGAGGAQDAGGHRLWFFQHRGGRIESGQHRQGRSGIVS